MILKIENLGVIKSAQVDLSKKLTVFCGGNNTGKTYASYIIQAFLTEDGVFNVIPSYVSVIQQFKETLQFRVTRQVVEEWLVSNCHAVKSQLESIFGISETTRRNLFGKFDISVEYGDDEFQDLLDSEFRTTVQYGSSMWNAVKTKGSDAVKFENCTGISSDGIEIMLMTRVVSVAIHRLVYGNMLGVRMLTVERNSIYTFKTELSLSRNELIDQIQQSDKSEFDILGFINKSSRRYPQAIRSSLRIANDLENVQKFNSKFAIVAEMIEKNLLKGEVSMTKNGDVEFHAGNMSKMKRLPFHLSSSIVKTMASLVIYLRHLANRGDVLIIDEPEMNFHPDVQVLLTRIFAILVSRGIHVLISTHSDYIIRELNNLIMAGTVCRRNNEADHLAVQTLGYSDEMVIDSSDISVLCFKNKGKRTVTVESVTVEEDGFAVESIDNTIIEQNKRAEELYSILIEDK